MEALRKVFFLGLLLTFSLFFGCSNPKIQPLPEEKFKDPGFLSFIQDGVTTREDVLVKLGAPDGRFEGDRILTYWLIEEKNSVWRMPPQNTLLCNISDDTFFSLVLVFGPGGVLEKHSLVGSK